MVNTAEADVICPTVAAENPDGLLSEVFFVVKYILLCFAVAVKAFKSSNEVCSSSLVSLTVISGVKISLSSVKYICRSLALSNNSLNL